MSDDVLDVRSYLRQPPMETTITAGSPLVWHKPYSSYLIPFDIVHLHWLVKERPAKISRFGFLVTPMMVYPLEANRPYTISDYNQKLRTVAIICEDCLRSLMHDSAALRTFLMEGLAAAHTTHMLHFEHALAGRLRHRLAHLLITLNYEAKDGVIEIKQVQLATILNVWRETLAAVMGGLQKQGYFKVWYGQIKLHDEAGLRRLAMGIG